VEFGGCFSIKRGNFGVTHVAFRRTSNNWKPKYVESETRQEREGHSKATLRWRRKSDHQHRLRSRSWRRKATCSRLGLVAGSTGSTAGAVIEGKRETEKEMKVKIVSSKDYVAGWLDTTIHDFLKVLSPSAASTKYALITCLDSNPNPASLRSKSPELKPIGSKLQVLGDGLLLPTKLLLETDSRSQVFFGFDEVWFFPSRDIEPKPLSASVVGPTRLNQVRFNKLGKWMSENSCSMALGGGEGLNFVVRAHGPVRFLLGYSIEQPDASLAA
jgi:hypothetical protein